MPLLDSGSPRRTVTYSSETLSRPRGVSVPAALPRRRPVDPAAAAAVPPPGPWQRRGRGRFKSLVRAAASVRRCSAA